MGSDIFLLEVSETSRVLKLDLSLFLEVFWDLPLDVLLLFRSVSAKLESSWIVVAAWALKLAPLSLCCRLLILLRTLMLLLVVKVVPGLTMSSLSIASISLFFSSYLCLMR